MLHKLCGRLQVLHLAVRESRAWQKVVFPNRLQMINVMVMLFEPETAILDACRPEKFLRVNKLLRQSLKAAPLPSTKRVQLLLKSKVLIVELILFQKLILHTLSLLHLHEVSLLAFELQIVQVEVKLGDKGLLSFLDLALASALLLYDVKALGIHF